MWEVAVTYGRLGADRKQELTFAGTWLEEAATGVPYPKNRTDQAP